MVNTFEVRRPSGSSFLIDDLGVVVDAFDTVNLADQYSIEAILESIDLAAALISGDLIRVLAGIDVIAADAYNDILAHTGGDFQISETGGTDPFEFNFTGGNYSVSSLVDRASAVSLTFTPSATNYVFVNSVGIITFNTTGFPSPSVALWEVVTDGSGATSITDRRSAYNSMGIEAHASSHEHESAGSDLPDLGKFQRTVRAQNTTAALLATDDIVESTPAGPITLTLPTNIAGRHVTVKRLSANPNTVTVVPAAGTIDGAASKILIQYEVATFVANGTNWSIY